MVLDIFDVCVGVFMDNVLSADEIFTCKEDLVGFAAEIGLVTFNPVNTAVHLWLRSVQLKHFY